MNPGFQTLKDLLTKNIETSRGYTSDPASAPALYLIEGEGEQGVRRYSENYANGIQKVLDKLTPAINANDLEAFEEARLAIKAEYDRYLGAVSDINANDTFVTEGMGRAIDLVDIVERQIGFTETSAPTM
ncbi:hypothetical protein [Mesorhizobium sp. SP-1A]|uniref:hypothetical protein n=1 Tax=Mesorhizobium sp. SP-1A TaxID=3077840 RepID=UPI0028F6FD1D|nr:hypothetical protein [Mesorhizobium sp. SP-1A]